MNVVPISALDLALAALLVLALGGLSLLLHLDIGRRLIWAATRAIVQLSLLGLVLKTVFASNNALIVGGIMLVMLSVAVYEVQSRQQRPLVSGVGYGISALSLLLTTFSMVLLMVSVLLQVEPWYSPQYVIPLLGMLLGNSMTGVAISLDRLTSDVWQRRGEIEGRLALGQDWREAVSAIRAQSLRSGLIPIMNGLATAGVVYLPGMMTGQILAGTEPFEAAKYQILILLLIAASTGFGASMAVWWTARRLFDDRQRLRLDRLVAPDPR